MKYKLTYFIVAPVHKTKKGTIEKPSLSSKSAPEYFSKSVPKQSLLAEEKAKIGELNVSLSAKTYHQDVVLIAGSVELNEIFSEKILGLKSELNKLCFKLAKKFHAKTDIYEEYSIYQVSDYTENIETIVAKNKEKIAGLLKSEKRILDEKEVQYTLSFALQYVKGDMVIVDWDGAFLFDPGEEFADEIKLLELANFQLLRYRLIDVVLDDHMREALTLIQQDSKKKWSLSNKKMESELRDVVRIHSRLIAQFESLERDVKLIGDWYPARMYELISKKLRLDKWRTAVKEKLESLEEMYAIAYENLGMSRNQRLELFQIRAFFVLQVGWLVLIVLEFFYFTR